MLLEQWHDELIVITFAYVAFVELELAPLKIELDVVLLIQ